MEYLDKWIACEKVPTDLRDLFETKNSSRIVGQKELNSSSDNVFAITILAIQQSVVEEQIFIFHANICLSSLGYHLVTFFNRMFYANRCHKHPNPKMR